MSAILTYGNIFEVTAEYENYVDYRVTDPTLNGWNYEPIFAARWVEPTEVAIAPRLLVVTSYRPMDAVVGFTDPIPGPQFIKGSIPVEPVIELADVPEPGYSLLVAVLLAFVCIRLRRVGRSSER